MQLTLTNILTMVALASTSVQGLGINCRGSAACKRNGALSDLSGFIQNIQLDRIYNNGEHIACRGQNNGILGIIDPNGGVCAFLQFTAGGISGNQIKSLTASLVEHGYNACGSVPINFPDSNDPSDGILTFNFVANTDNPCPNGLC
jgi:hypothetical protein